MGKVLSNDERKALAMHELMKREQEFYAERVREQRKINAMTTDELKTLVGNVTEPSILTKEQS